MSWANLDDRFHSHPKVRRLQRLGFEGAEALGIWSWCLSWCRAYSPEEGRVTVEEIADAWGADAEHVADVMRTLLRAGLVDEELFGVFLIHDWTDWQHGGAARQSEAGKARAASAERDDGGRFLPVASSKLGQLGASSRKLDEAGVQPGHASPGRTSPLRTSPGRGGPPARIGSELRRRAPWPEHEKSRS